MKTFMIWLLSVGILASGLCHWFALKEIRELHARASSFHIRAYRQAIQIDQLERRLYYVIGDLETLSDEVLERCLTKQPRPPMMMH